MAITFKKTAASGISYNRPVYTGQTTSYRTGDAVWVNTNRPFNAPPANPASIATLSDYYTLSTLNAFGNYYRFTDQSGNLGMDISGFYTSDSLIDHYTGLEWGANGGYNISNSKTWDECIDDCYNLNLHGFTDWYLPSIEEYLSVVRVENSGSTFSLVGAGRVFFTSNTNKNDTTDAYYYYSIGTGTGLVSTSAKTSGSRNYYAVRRRY